jgi:hypothetical protein
VKKIKGGTFEQDSIDEMLDKAMFAANKLNAAFIQWQKESQS